MIVKSRRAASSAQSSVKATVARRPSVATSRRRVVTSTGVPAATAVIVPCAIPVGTALIRAASSRFTTSSGVSRVARSTSLCSEPEQGVAHAAADEPRRAALGVERGKQPVHVAAVPPGCVGKRGHDTSASRRLKFTIIAAVAPQMRCSPQSIS